MKNIKQKGFTLIELLIVIVILGILAVAVAPKFVNFSADAKEASAEGVEGALKAAVQIGVAEIAMGSSSAVKASSYPDATEKGIGVYFDADGLTVLASGETGAVAGEYKVTVQTDGASDTAGSCTVTYKLDGYTAGATDDDDGTASGYSVETSTQCKKTSS